QVLYGSPGTEASRARRFGWNDHDDNTPRFDDAKELKQTSHRIWDVFEGMVRYDNVYGRTGHIVRVGVDHDTRRACVIHGGFIDFHSQPMGAIKTGQYPSRSTAEVEDYVGLSDVPLEDTS